MTGRLERLDGRAVLALLACCAFWGAQQGLVKATPELAPVFQAAVRFAGALALLLAWCAWRGVRLLDRDGTLGAGLLAGTLFAGEFAALVPGACSTPALRA